MKKEIKELIEMSNKYGKNPDFVIAGGGNSSYKDKTILWVKASGTSLATIGEAGFATLDRTALAAMAVKKYSEDETKREEEVKFDLLRAAIDPSSTLRPSVEASLHDLLPFKFVMHTHPWKVNALSCAKEAATLTAKLIPDALYIPYTDPGYILSVKVAKEMSAFEKKNGFAPKIVILQNHGIFVAADTTAEIDSIYNTTLAAIDKEVGNLPTAEALEIAPVAKEILPALRMILSDDETKICSTRYNSRIESFIKDKTAFQTIATPYTPDHIVYCKSSYLYVAQASTAEKTIDALQKAVEKFKADKGYMPKVIAIAGIGIVAADSTMGGCQITLDLFEDMMKIADAAAKLGKVNPMSKAAISFIDNWEVENYRKKISLAAGMGRVFQKVTVITGGAQGFGAGIADHMFKEGANIVIADLNEDLGNKKAEELNNQGKKNRAIFVKTNVGEEDSVRNLMRKTVESFGGVDVFISNAGILRAGGLPEMELSAFELMTKINYTAYFICTKMAAEVFKIQDKYKKGYLTDIIQINSKSGLKGSNKNFAYAGGKFGGIGLTQSFAMELMPYGVKVNSICPGNFFDGPLWADPVKGLFVQYLKAGKVAGAKTIEDVKKFYEAQVPAGRGCESMDVARAIFYIIEQAYETGQAVPVTGGQNMLN